MFNSFNLLKSPFKQITKRKPGAATLEDLRSPIQEELYSAEKNDWVDTANKQAYLFIKVIKELEASTAPKNRSPYTTFIKKIEDAQTDFKVKVTRANRRIAEARSEQVEDKKKAAQGHQGKGEAAEQFHKTLLARIKNLPPETFASDVMQKRLHAYYSATKHLHNQPIPELSGSTNRRAFYGHRYEI